ncbi:hypothetical protein GCM10011505_51010 [Tistrella bauzanensis]|uniref:Uncharacterized protein n=1 Tax=Tistrella bauzanensis TaxID=657419 RepID=A0ABQ1JBQ5_9PROT|nr:hypothetical protein GCM10011505_51010 [Tistrella bauzanensis]
MFDVNGDLWQSPTVVAVTTPAARLMTQGQRGAGSLADRKGRTSGRAGRQGNEFRLTR